MFQIIICFFDIIECYYIYNIYLFIFTVIIKSRLSTEVKKKIYLFIIYLHAYLKIYINLFNKTKYKNTTLQ